MPPMARVTLFELGFLLVPLGLLLLAVTRNRPRVDRFVACQRSRRRRGRRRHHHHRARSDPSLPRARRLGRVPLGVVAGLVMAQSIGASGWTVVFNAIAGLLVGSFVGIAISQRTPPRDIGPDRSASLTVRDVDAFRTPHGTTLIRVATAGFVVAAAVVAASQPTTTPRRP